MFTIRPSARLGAVVVGLALPVVLAACGGMDTPSAAPQSTPDASAAPAAGAEHDDADIRFAQMMIPHHQQAIEMATLAAQRAGNPEVRALAQQIQAAQDPEIATLTGFLQAWGAEVPSTGSMSGMGHGDMPGMDHAGMAGMMTQEQMDQLDGAAGTAFDTMFLQMMIVHHRGAVADAQRELAEGTNPQAKAMAQRIIDAQTAEISRMDQLLQR